jgi:hypothetical protein
MPKASALSFVRSAISLTILPLSTTLAAAQAGHAAGEASLHEL